MIFTEIDRFHKKFPNFELIENTPTECLNVIVAGGVIAKSRTIQLPSIILNLINGVDKLLVTSLPSVFALGRQICIRKKF